jgi:L-aspartate oxidase
LRAHAFTTGLILENSRVIGLRFIDETDGSLHEVRAGAVLLATGGLGQLYRETTNPAVATGDGMAIAYEAGAVLSDMEFVQFHPTALAIKGAPRFLLSEALRGEGGILRNINLERFMKRYAEAQELAPRDVVARAIVSEMHRTHAEHVYLDMTAKSAEFLQKRFPRIYSTCLSYGLDLATDMAPVCPAAHYMMGGVKTDLWGRSSVPGLYAAGETADTGVHGANRLASNSLLEGLVFGARAGEAMSKDAPAARHKSAPLPGSLAPIPGNSAPGTLPNHAEKSPPSAQLTQIRDLMWRHVGILRNGKELLAALQSLQKIELPAAAHIAETVKKHLAASTADAAPSHSTSAVVAAAKQENPTRADHELCNLHTLATLICRSAIAREESRGSHYRADFPYRHDDALQKHSLVQRGKDVTFES